MRLPKLISIVAVVGVASGCGGTAPSPDAGSGGGATGGGGGSVTGSGGGGVTGGGGGIVTGGGGGSVTGGGGGSVTGGGGGSVTGGGGGSVAGGGVGGGGGAATDGGLLFFDDFNYALGRLDSAATKRAVTMSAGYSGFKDEQTNPGGARGYLYSVSSIEGDTSGVPGGGNALCMETRARTLQGQTDFYVQLGNNTPGAFPANLWIQLWIYVQDDVGSSKRSVITGRNKFIYPLLGSRTGYPMATEDTAWLMGFRPFATDLSQGTRINQPSPAAICFETRGLHSGASGPRANHPHLVGTGLEDYLYPNMNVPSDSDRFILPNQWYLVRFHFDTSGATDSNTSKYEAWWRVKGSQAGGLIKRAEYIGGQAAPGSASFSYHSRVLDNQGAKMLRIPTTIGDANGGDSWIYLKDLAIASEPSQLPVYANY